MAALLDILRCPSPRTLSDSKTELRKLPGFVLQDRFISAAIYEIVALTVRALEYM